MNLARNALLLTILLTTGCMALVAGGVAAVGTYTYVSGQLNRTYNANLERTYAHFPVRIVTAGDAARTCRIFAFVL